MKSIIFALAAANCLAVNLQVETQTEANTLFRQGDYEYLKGNIRAFDSNGDGKLEPDEVVDVLETYFSKEIRHISLLKGIVSTLGSDVDTLAHIVAGSIS